SCGKGPKIRGFVENDVRMKAEETRRGGCGKCRGTCLWGLAPEMAEAGKSHGKPACPPKELGASKTSYASTIIGVQDPVALAQGFLGGEQVMQDRADDDQV